MTGSSPSKDEDAPMIWVTVTKPVSVTVTVTRKEFKDNRRNLL